MIRQPMLSNENEIFGNGNGLKHRVTACRKRLRHHRIHKGHVDNHLEELFRETAIGALQFRGYLADDHAVGESLVEGVHAREGETLQRIDEQEVGLT